MMDGQQQMLKLYADNLAIKYKVNVVFTNLKLLWLLCIMFFYATHHIF